MPKRWKTVFYLVVTFLLCEFATGAVFAEEAKPVDGPKEAKQEWTWIRDEEMPSDLKKRLPEHVVGFLSGRNDTSNSSVTTIRAVLEDQNEKKKCTFYVEKEELSGYYPTKDPIETARWQWRKDEEMPSDLKQRLPERLVARMVKLAEALPAPSAKIRVVLSDAWREGGQQLYYIFVEKVDWVMWSGSSPELGGSLQQFLERHRTNDLRVETPTSVAIQNPEVFHELTEKFVERSREGRHDEGELISLGNGISAYVVGPASDLAAMDKPLVKKAILKKLEGLHRAKRAETSERPSQQDDLNREETHWVRLGNGISAYVVEAAGDRAAMENPIVKQAIEKGIYKKLEGLHQLKGLHRAKRAEASDCPSQQHDLNRKVYATLQRIEQRLDKLEGQVNELTAEKSKAE